jgi:hypothetical protein
VKVVYIGGQQVTTADKYLSTTFVPDQNDNDVTELAVMRVHPVTGQPTVTVIDGSSGDTLTEIYFGDSNIIPKIITGISTPNGTALRVVGTDKRNSSEYVEQRYVKSGALVE